MTLDDLPQGGFPLPYFHDSGHGWIKAPLDFIDLFGLKPTRYSYTDHAHVYLEEDRDAPELIRALREHAVDFYLYDLRYAGDCFIRKLPRYTAAEPRNRGQMPLDLD